MEQPGHQMSWQGDVLGFSQDAVHNLPSGGRGVSCHGRKLALHQDSRVIVKGTQAFAEKRATLALQWLEH